MMIHGIQILEGMGENDWAMANIIALAVMKPFENDKVKMSGSGYVPNIDRATRRPTFPPLTLQYARTLVDSGAFVPNKDYDVVTGMDEETLDTVVMELVPTDPQVKQHFIESLKAYKA